MQTGSAVRHKMRTQGALEHKIEIIMPTSDSNMM